MVEQQKQLIIKELKDHFSISLQLYYKYNDSSWTKHIDICIFLVNKLKDSIQHKQELQEELLEKVYSICNTQEYTITVI